MVTVVGRTVVQKGGIIGRIVEKADGRTFYLFFRQKVKTKYRVLRVRPQGL